MRRPALEKERELEEYLYLPTAVLLHASVRINHTSYPTEASPALHKSYDTRCIVPALVVDLVGVIKIKPWSPYHDPVSHE